MNDLIKGIAIGLAMALRQSGIRLDLSDMAHKLTPTEFILLNAVLALFAAVVVFTLYKVML